MLRDAAFKAPKNIALRKEAGYTPVMEVNRTVKRAAKPRRILYKVIGTCRLCKIRFVVDKEKGHFSGNYCMTCVKKFNQGGD